MKTSDTVGEGMLALFALGWLLFNPPLLLALDHGGTVLGIPTLYAILFSEWLLLIVFMALVVERGQDDDAADFPADPSL